MSEKVLITGGTGTVGTRLTTLLKQKGYKVHILSRKADHSKNIYAWDVKKGFVEPEAFNGVTKVIHLAGAGVAEGRWTDDRKKEIIDSRVKSTELLYNHIKNNHLPIDCFASASATGYYGFDTADRWIDENENPGKDFLAEVVVEWEKAVSAIATLGIRTVYLRTGIVLSEHGGALEKIAQPVKFGAGVAFASGKQWMSWIHEDDLCNMYIFALENERMHGAYNAIAPQPETNAGLTKEIARTLKRPLILPNVPGFVLKLMLGEFANVLIGGNRVSCEKIQKDGFIFAYPKLNIALNDLLK